MKETIQNQKKSKARFFSLALIAVFMALVVIACWSIVDLHATAETNPDYSVQINVKETDGGYLYGNGDAYVFADSVQSAINSICQNVGANTSISIYFENVTTNESLTFSEKTFYLSGELVSTKTTFNVPFIDVLSGKLQMLGLVLHTSSSAVKVGEKAVFTFSGSQILVKSESSEYSAYALNVNGRAEILDGVIDLESKYTSGSALSGSNPSSSIVVGAVGSSENILIRGNSACVFNSGNVEINSGKFEATHPTFTTGGVAGSTLSGYAILISSDSVVNVNGGHFSSVTPTNTIKLNGNRNSRLCFNGGEVQGQILLTGKNNSSIFEIGGASVSSVSGINVVVKSNDSLLTPENAILSAIDSEGTKFVSWHTTEGDLFERELSFSLLPEGETTVVYTNVFEVTFKFGNKTVVKEFAYGETIDILDHITDSLEGLELECWLKDGLEIEGHTFVVTGYNQITARLTLKKPTLQELESVTKVYDGNAIVLTASSTHEVATLSFVWEKFDKDLQTFVSISTEQTLTLLGVSASGEYRVTVFAEYNGYTSEITSDIVSIQIERAHHSDIPAIEFSGVYSRFKTLADFELPFGFKWVDETINPQVSLTEYSATYCEDAENFYEETVSVKLTLSKANVTDDFVVYPHNSMSGVYSPDKTLKDYALKEFYFWKNPDLTPVCSRVYYEIYYNPDQENYENYEMTVALSLEKATFSNVEDLFIETSYHDGMTLYSLRNELPVGYSFANQYPSFVYLTVGRSEFDLIYNLDQENYEDYLGAKAVLSISKGTPDFRGYTFYDVYAPNKTLADYVFSDGQYLRWVDDSVEVLFGENEYDAIFNPDSDLFNDLIVKITIILSKAVADGMDPSYSVDVVYSKNLTLGDIELAEGYRFLSPDVVLKAGDNQKFEALYNPNPEFYEDGSLWITVNVKKATISTEGFVFADLTAVYDGSEHFVTFSGNLPDGVEFVEYLNNGQTNAGTYEVTCVLKQVDTENYELVDLTFKATLTIEKATPRFVAESEQSFVYDGNAKKAIVTVDNKEQTLKSDIENKFVKVGVYKIRFTVSESKNYLAGEITITVVVKTNVLTVSKDGVSASIVDDLKGFDADEELTIEIVETKDGLLKISLSFKGNSLEGRKVIIHCSSAKYDVSKLKSILDSKGNKVSFEIDKKTNDVILLSGELGEFELSFKEAKYSYAVEITLGVLASVAIVAIIIYLIVSKRRKNHEEKN